MGKNILYIEYEDTTMDSLTAAIQRCQLSIQLDNETKGQGNCFSNSIVKQCRTPEVRRNVERSLKDFDIMMKIS